MTERTMARLVLIETVSNQDYVFGSNRLRECVGASQLIHLVGTKWVFEAIDEALDVSDPYSTFYSADARRMAAQIRAAGENFALPRRPVEIIAATSGKAVLLIEDRGDGAAFGASIVRRVTRKALERAPGLTVRGAVGDPFCLDGDAAAAHEAVAEGHRRLAANRAFASPAEARFPTLPVFEPCVSTGAPAQALVDFPDGALPASAAVEAKRAAMPDGVNRVMASTGVNDLAFNPERLDDIENWSGGFPWLATIHADGNGFGKVFQEFDACYAKSGSADTARGYLASYRDFSVALDLLGLAAFAQAAKAAPPRGRRKRRPLVPLVLGGDDLTVICAGKDAITFACTYLDAFAAGTARDEAICKLAGDLGAAAGVALVKPHHPFHHAYALSEELCKSAKQVKARIGPEVCALDWHMHYDGSALDLDAQRKGWMSAPKPQEEGASIRLTSRPYTLGYDGKATWAQNRRFEDLNKAAAALSATEDGGKDGLPRSQQHRLREAAFRAVDSGAPEPLTSAFALIRHRYPKARLDLLAPGGRILFDDPGGGKRTLLLDAMDLLDLGAASREPEPEPAIEGEGAS